jgi:hypothetical protein
MCLGILAKRKPTAPTSVAGLRKSREEACRLFELLLNDRPSFNQLVTLRMGSDPHPHMVGTILHGKRAVVETYSR